MRRTPWLAAEPYRVHPRGYESFYGADYGCFEIPHPKTGARLRVLVSAGDAETRWDHVSVSLPNRCPNWPEMEFVKRIFFEDDEAAMQLHAPVAEQRSMHPYCLHIWRPLDAAIPLPPGLLVAPDDAAPDPEIAEAVKLAGGA